MSLIDLGLPWDGQPDEFVGPTTESRLRDGLAGLWNLASLEPINAVTGELAVIQTAALVSSVVTPAGLSARLAYSSNSKAIRLAASRQRLLGGPSTTQVTVAYLARLEGNAERGSAFACTFDGDDLDGFKWDPNAADAARRFVHGTTQYATAIRTADAFPVLRVFSAGPAGFWWSEDGVIQATSATPATALSANDVAFFIGGSGRDAFGNWPQAATGIAVWRDAKPESFAQTLGRNFGQLFEPRRIGVPVSAGGGGGITGTLASTLGDLSASSTGAVAIAGSASQTLVSVALAATGVLAIAGSSSAVLADVSASAVGALAVAGTAAPTLEAATLSATGALPIVGALSQTLTDAGLASTGGGAENAGTLAATLDDAIIAATGALPIVGAVTATLDDATSVATGSAAIAGALGITLGDLVLSGAGRLALAGEIAATLADATLAAAGSDPDSAASAASVWAYVLSDGKTAGETLVENNRMLRIVLAALTGTTSGIGTDTETYFGDDGTTPRVVATFDGQGNRLTVVTDGAP